MSKLTLLFSVVAGLLLISPPLSAHHGAGMYDRTTTVSLIGTVTQFHFVNPHVLIYLTVVDEDGHEVEWSGELTSPNRLARIMSAGEVKWHKDLLTPGDEISVTGNPARNGAPVLWLNRVDDADGTTLIGAGR